MATVTTSLDGAGIPDSTACVILDSGALATFESARPLWRVATRQASDSANFTLWRSPATVGSISSTSYYQTGHVEWRLADLAGQLTGSANVSPTVTTLASASVGNLVVLDDGRGFWVPVKVLTVV